VAQYNLVTEEQPPDAGTAQKVSSAVAEQKALGTPLGDALRRDVLRRISTKDICRVTRQLATLLRAGMPLVPALSALVEQLQDTRAAFSSERKNAGPSSRRLLSLKPQVNPLAQVMQDVRDRVNAGSALSAALGRYPDVFSDVFVNMIAAGQTGGVLEEVLLRLAEMLEKRVHLAGKVKSVIAYPLMMAVVAFGVVVFLLSFVVPSITQIFLEMDQQLPWPTTLLISICAFMKTYWILFPIVVCGACFAVGAWLRTEKGALTWDRSKLKLPLFGGLFLKLEIARLARTLGVLLASGIPILTALETTKGVVRNRFIANALDSVKDCLGRGDNIAEAMGKAQLFPPIVVHIIATGQISGGLEDGLMDIADMYDGEVELTAKTLTSLLEPAILLVMGAVVGFIVLAVLLPIFEINQVI